MAEANSDTEYRDNFPEGPQQRRDCVIVDTNVLRSSYLLKTAMGAALLFAIQRRNARLGWAEVIEDEIRKHARRSAEESLQKIREGLTAVGMLIGWRPDPKLPSSEEIDSAISNRITELNPLLTRVGFTIEHARAALRPVNDEMPPNSSKNQQFKDSAVWEAILEIAATNRVHFVTEDNDFYEGRDRKTGRLAKELSNECHRAGLEVHVYPELASCLEALRTATPRIDVGVVVAALNDPLRMIISPEAARRDFALGEMSNLSVSAFITERPTILAIKYEVVYSGIDISPQMPPRTEVSIRASGNAQFDMASAVASNLQLDHLQFRFVDAEGEHSSANVYIAALSDSFAERLVPYRLKHPIDL